MIPPSLFEIRLANPKFGLPYRIRDNLTFNPSLALWDLRLSDDGSLLQLLWPLLSYSSLLFSKVFMRASPLPFGFVGKQLIEFAEQLAKDLNCKGTWLVSGFGREEKAHKFYKSLGYVSTGYRFVKQ
jgi:hypothetical protein